MIVRGHRVYRGSRSASTRLPSILLFILVAFLLIALAVFSLLPQYLVYHRQSVEMVVPMLEESGQPYTVTAVTMPGPYAGNAVSGFQVTEPDYSLVDLSNVRGLGYMRGYYVPLNKINETGLDSVVRDAERNGLKGLILQMKDETGALAWMSGVATASSNAANSAWDPSATLAELKADGWYLAAEICCAVDNLLADKNPDVALRDGSGNVYEDAWGKWVDPWNRTVRSYTVELCQDLLSMGFDEIILRQVAHPNGEVRYTRNVASNLNRTACAMNFAIAVRQALDKDLTGHGAHLCAVVTHDVLTADGASNGQNLDYFLKVFDRIIIPTGTYGHDVSAFLDRKIDSTIRFVPQMTWAFGGASVIMDPAAPAAQYTKQDRSYEQTI